MQLLSSLPKVHNLNNLKIAEIRWNILIVPAGPQIHIVPKIRLDATFLGDHIFEIQLTFISGIKTVITFLLLDTGKMLSNLHTNETHFR